jgi:hypothetical protein
VKAVWRPHGYRILRWPVGGLDRHDLEVSEMTLAAGAPATEPYLACWVTAPASLMSVPG